MTDSPPGITAAPNNDNLRHFDVTVAGPESSPYEGEWSTAQELCLCHSTTVANPRRRVQAGAVFARRVPDEPAKSPVPH